MVATFVFFPLLLWYLYVRRQTARPSRAPDRYQRAVATVVWAHVGSLLVMAAYTPPDPITQMRYYPLVVAVALIAMYVLVYRGGYNRIRRHLE